MNLNFNNGPINTATLVDGKVPASQLPSYVDDILEGYYYSGEFYKESAHTNPLAHDRSKLYLDLTDDLNRYVYRWSGTTFVQVGGNEYTAGTGIDINNGVISGDRIYAVDFVSGQSYNNRVLVYKDNELYEYNTNGTNTVTDSNFSQYFSKYNPPTMYSIDRVNKTRPYKWHFWLFTGNIANTYRLYFADSSPSVCTPATFYSTAQDSDNSKQVCEVEYRYQVDGVYKYVGLSLVNKSNPSTGVYNIAFAGMLDNNTMVIFEHNGTGDYFVKTERSISGDNNVIVHLTEDGEGNIICDTSIATIKGYYDAEKLVYCQDVNGIRLPLVMATSTAVSFAFGGADGSHDDVMNGLSYIGIISGTTDTWIFSQATLDGKMTEIYNSSTSKSKYTPSELKDMMESNTGMTYNGIAILKSSYSNSKFYFYFLDNYMVEYFKVDSDKNVSRVTQRILVDDNELSGAISSHNSNNSAHTTLFNGKANVNHTHNGNDVSYSPSTVYDNGTVGKAISGKQDTLTAGQNITIENNVISATGGSGAVNSVNGQTGDVVLDGDDIAYDSTDSVKDKILSHSQEIVNKITNPQSKSNGQVLTYNGENWVAQNPSGGTQIQYDSQTGNYYFEVEVND